MNMSRSRQPKTSGNPNNSPTATNTNTANWNEDNAEDSFTNFDLSAYHDATDAYENDISELTGLLNDVVEYDNVVTHFYHDNE